MQCQTFMWGAGSRAIRRHNGPASPSSKLPGSFYPAERRMRLLKMGNYDIFFIVAEKAKPQLSQLFWRGFRKALRPLLSSSSPWAPGRALFAIIIPVDPSSCTRQVFAEFFPHVPFLPCTWTTGPLNQSKETVSKQPAVPWLSL